MCFDDGEWWWWWRSAGLGLAQLGTKFLASQLTHNLSMMLMMIMMMVITVSSQHNLSMRIMILIMMLIKIMVIMMIMILIMVDQVVIIVSSPHNLILMLNTDHGDVGGEYSPLIPQPEHASMIKVMMMRKHFCWEAAHIFSVLPNLLFASRASSPV